MDSPPEVLAFVLANTGIFLVSSVLAGLSYLAYRQSDGRRTFRTAGIGFGFVLLGGLVEPAYQMGVRGDYHIDGAELLWLQTGEGVLITIGLALLFYAITRHRPDPQAESAAHDMLPEERAYAFDFGRSDD